MDKRIEKNYKKRSKKQGVCVWLKKFKMTERFHICGDEE